MTVTVGQARSLATRLLRHAGLSQDKAEATARAVVLADADTGPLLSYDGGGGLGHWQLTQASRDAVASAATYGKAGTPLPDGWALDANGQPTNDPVAALTGLLAPLGGAKGFALAFMVEAMTAGLIGPRLSADVPDFFDPQRSADPQQISHLVLAIDPARTDAAGDPDAARTRFGELAERVVLPVDESKFAHPEPVVLCELDRHLPQWSASFTTRP